MSAFRVVLFLFIGVMLTSSAYAQVDKEFWFAPPEVSRSTSDFDRPIKLFISTFGQKAEVTVSHPAQPALAPIIITIPRDSTGIVDLTPRMTSVESGPPDVVLKTGLLIKSTAPIAVYYEVVSELCKCNPEIFVLKGINALGTSFMIPSQTLADNSPIYAPKPTSSFDIVATQNSTTVTITPAKALVGHAAIGVPYNVTLNAGEVYSAAAVGGLASDHFAGSTVVSDKPVAITLKDDLVYVSSGPKCAGADLTGDQLVPLRLLGTEYIAMQGRLSIKDRLFVTATRNNTAIYQDNVLINTINLGETEMLTINGPSTYVTASNPISVLQLSGVGCEVGSTILPSLGCTGSYSVAFSRSSNQPFIVTLLTRNGGQGGFLVDGAPNVITPGLFTVVPNTGGQYYTASIEMNNVGVGSAVTVTNTAMMFHLGMLNGDSTVGARYGYFSNYGNIAPIVWTNTPLCQNDSVQLFTHNITSARYAWIGPSGFRSSSYKPFIYPAPTSASGVYKLTMNANGCTGTSEVDLTVNPRPILNATPRVSYICPGEAMELKASGADSLVWWPESNIDTTIGGVYSASPLTRTKYYVKGFLENECTNIDSAIVEIKTLPNVKIQPDTVITKCPGTTIALTASGGAKYTWNPVTYLSATSGANVSTTAKETIVYEVTAVSADGCIGKAKVVVNVGDTVIQDYSFSMCVDSVFPFGGLQIKESGTYTHHFKTNTGCDSIVTINVSMREHPTADFIFLPIEPELNVPVQFYSKSPDAVKWQWVFGDGRSSTDENPSHLFYKSGKMKVCLEVRNAGNCPDTICKPIDALANLSVDMPGAFTPNGDGANDVLYIYGGAATEVHLRIYNRWGQMVFETRDIKQGWDGTYKGVPQRPDSYAYVLSAVFIDGSKSTKSGSITLLR